MRTTAASGTDGGTLTSNTWTTRDLNHTYTNNGSFATVSTSNNTVTLNAGTYYVRFWATGYGVQEHQAQLYNSTDSYVFLSGSNQRPSSSIENSNSIGSGIVSFGGPGAKAFLIRQIVDYTRATYGGGRHLIMMILVVEILSIILIGGWKFGRLVNYGFTINIRKIRLYAIKWSVLGRSCATSSNTYEQLADTWPLGTFLFRVRTFLKLHGKSSRAILQPTNIKSSELFLVTLPLQIN